MVLLTPLRQMELALGAFFLMARDERLVRTEWSHGARGALPIAMVFLLRDGPRSLTEGERHGQIGHRN